MEARAVSRHARVAPRKARAVVDLVKGKDVSEALTILKFVNRRASKFVEKTVKSAASNAIDIGGKDKLNMDALYIKEARVDEGATMKRFRPRAYGRASMIRHRTSHITIVVGEKK